jgi:hypothetical protein
MAARVDLARDAFAGVYNQDSWNLEKLVPEPAEHAHFAALINGVMDRHGITSVTEFGCGFWSYAKLIDWTGKSYDGYDVFDGAIKWNNDLYAAPNVRFHLNGEGVTLAGADLLVCKDVLQHLPTADVLHYLAVFKPAVKWLLIANDINSECGTNTDIAHGGHRGLRLDWPPFNEACETLDEWVLPAYPTYQKRACLLRGAL